MHADRIGRTLARAMAFAIAALALWGPPAVAHQRQLIRIGASDYLLVIGFLAEPVFTGDRTGLDLRVVLPMGQIPSMHGPQRSNRWRTWIKP